MSQNYSISKTSFLKFEQCQKAFFLYKNFPYLRDKYSVDKQLTFKRGHDVGFFAQQLFSGGIDVSKETKNSLQGVEFTKTLIENKTEVIYEATFLFNGVLIMVDILVLSENKYVAYEVKSSLKVSEIYLKDACLQYYVLKNSLLNFDDLYLVTLNSDYILNGEIEPKKLFKKRSIKLKAEENLEYLTHQLNSAHLLLEQNSIPNIAIGKQCFKPYLCDYFGTCWKDTIQPESIFNLPFFNKDKLFEWYNSGLKNIHQISDSLIEKESLIHIKNAFVSGKTIINSKKIQQLISKINQPVVAMDMEIWSAALPQLQNTKPFEQIPFLVCFFDGEHYSSFFCGHETDQRKEFANQLIELSKKYATILVYDKTMEVAIIDNLIKNYREFEADLTLLKSKLVDLFEVFLNLDYYDPKFKNNFSLKTVSSILLNDVSYTKINSGLEAMNYYEQYRVAENDIDRGVIKLELIDYCNTDSMATFRLMEFLKEL